MLWSSIAKYVQATFRGKKALLESIKAKSCSLLVPTKESLKEPMYTQKKMKNQQHQPHVRVNAGE